MPDGGVVLCLPIVWPRLSLTLQNKDEKQRFMIAQPPLENCGRAGRDFLSGF